jgi:hypothetical protein
MTYIKIEASFKALDMLGKGLQTEKAALAVIGTHEEAYSVALYSSTLHQGFRLVYDCLTSASLLPTDFLFIFTP